MVPSLSADTKALCQRRESLRTCALCRQLLQEVPILYLQSLQLVLAQSELVVCGLQRFCPLANLVQFYV